MGVLGPVLQLGEPPAGWGGSDGGGGAGSTQVPGGGQAHRWAAPQGMHAEGVSLGLHGFPLLVMGREQALDRLGGCSGQRLPALALAGSRAPLRTAEQLVLVRTIPTSACPLSQRAALVSS